MNWKESTPRIPPRSRLFRMRSNSRGCSFSANPPPPKKRDELAPTASAPVSGTGEKMERLRGVEEEEECEEDEEYDKIERLDIATPVDEKAR